MKWYHPLKIIFQKSWSKVKVWIFKIFLATNGESGSFVEDLSGNVNLFLMIEDRASEDHKDFFLHTVGKFR